MNNSKVFKWSQRKEWERVLWRLLADKLSDPVISEVKRRNPRYLLDDKFAWLNESVAIVKGQMVEDIPGVLGTRLSSSFNYVTAFHGSRPASPDDFLTHGLKPSNTGALQRRAIELFGDSENVRNAILELRGEYERHNNGGIWLGVTKESFLQEHDHYLLEGSEYLAAIAGRTGHSAILQAIGKPVIVECLVPNEFLDSKFWPSMGRHMIEDHFARLLRPSEKRPVNTHCIRITKTIPPEKILRVHEFSERRRTRIWIDSQTGARQRFKETVLRPLKIWVGQEAP